MAEYVGLEVVEGVKKGVLLVKLLEAIKTSKVKKDESTLLDESALLDRQFQLQEKNLRS